MEKYDVISMKELERADYFYYFMSVGTTIEFTVKLDVTSVIERCRKETINFQAFMLFRIYKAINTIVSQGNLPANIFNVSCIPWLHFEHFSSNSKTMENNLVKMITIGKYKKVNGRFILPFTMQVSHAIADGYHISLFYERLQEELNTV